MILYFDLSIEFCKTGYFYKRHRNFDKGKREKGEKVKREKGEKYLLNIINRYFFPFHLFPFNRAVVKVRDRCL